MRQAPGPAYSHTPRKQVGKGEEKNTIPSDGVHTPLHHPVTPIQQHHATLLHLTWFAGAGPHMAALFYVFRACHGLLRASPPGCWGRAAVRRASYVHLRAAARRKNKASPVMQKIIDRMRGAKKKYTYPYIYSQSVLCLQSEWPFVSSTVSQFCSWCPGGATLRKKNSLLNT